VPFAPGSGLSYWQLTLIAASGDLLLVLLAAVLAFMYLRRRRTPVGLWVRRAGRGHRLAPLPGERGPADLAQ
jgi:hypothetical protein